MIIIPEELYADLWIFIFVAGGPDFEVPNTGRRGTRPEPIPSDVFYFSLSQRLIHLFWCHGQAQTEESQYSANTGRGPWKVLSAMLRSEPLPYCGHCFRLNHTMDYSVVLKHSDIISPFIKDICAEAGQASYTRYEDIMKWSNIHGKRLFEF